ncbi:MAG TPA: SUKH-4 family immunity protein [Pirellulales bacterium]|jgi:hypothetical protein|nr:SUKH-4 family immunity protein [Pirellulales bacterium]
MFSPETFAAAWGSEALVRLSSENTTNSIPASAREFLSRAGLPALITYVEDEPLFKITFCRLEAGLTPVLMEKYHGTLPGDWNCYWVLGDEYFSNGAAWWCIDQRDGRILRIDIELAEPIMLANASVAHFTSALLVAVSWSAQQDCNGLHRPDAVNQLERQLNELDPECMRSGGSFWRRYVARLVGQKDGGFAKGSMSAGHDALIDGTW